MRWTYRICFASGRSALLGAAIASLENGSVLVSCGPSGVVVLRAKPRGRVGPSGFRPCHRCGPSRRGTDSSSGSLIRLADEDRLGSLERRDRLVAGDRGKLVEELAEAVAGLEALHEYAHWHPRARESRCATKAAKPRRAPSHKRRERAFLSRCEVSGVNAPPYLADTCN